MSDRFRKVLGEIGKEGGECQEMLAITFHSQTKTCVGE